MSTPMLSLASEAVWLGLQLAVTLLHFCERLIGVSTSMLDAAARFLIILMEPLVPRSTLTRLKRLFNWRERPLDGEKGGQLYRLPVYQRQDGFSVRVGCLVVQQTGGKLYTVRDILVRADLAAVSLVLSPAEVREADRLVTVLDEETVCTVEDVQPAEENCLALAVARNSLDMLARNAKDQPLHIQRMVRKHQLAVTIRREIQRFLAGFSMSGVARLGNVDWRLDLGLLGLEHGTEFSLEHRVERAVGQVGQLDLLLGRGWDVRSVSGDTGFRVLLTLELQVDTNQDLQLSLQATLMSGKITPDYRAVCLKDPGSLLQLSTRRLSDVTNNRSQQMFDVTPGQTLAWDEYPGPALCSQSTETSPYCGLPSVTASLEEMFSRTAGLSTFPSNSTAGFTSLEKLLSAVPKSQLNFNSPMKDSGEPCYGEETADLLDLNLAGPPSLVLTPHPSSSLAKFNVFPNQNGSYESNEGSNLKTFNGQSSKQDKKEPTESDNISESKNISKEKYSNEATNCGDDMKPNIEVKQLIKSELVPAKYVENLGDISKDEAYNLKKEAGNLKNVLEEKVQVRESLTEENEESVKVFEEERSESNVEAYLKSGWDDGSDSVKPSPNISMDELEVANSARTSGAEPAASLAKRSDPCLPSELARSNQNYNLNGACSLPPQPASPTRHTSLSRVQEYVQSLPSPAHYSRNGTAGTTGSREEDGSGSICSEMESATPSRASRQSDLSSLTAARMGCGLFYGSVGGVQQQQQPVCPFPQEWQSAIPESIENEDDID